MWVQNDDIHICQPTWPGRLNYTSLQKPNRADLRTSKWANITKETLNNENVHDWTLSSNNHNHNIFMNQIQYIAMSGQCYHTAVKIRTKHRKKTEAQWNAETAWWMPMNYQKIQKDVIYATCILRLVLTLKQHRRHPNAVWITTICAVKWWYKFIVLYSYGNNNVQACLNTMKRETIKHHIRQPEQ